MTKEKKETEALRRLKVLETKGLMNDVVSQYAESKQIFFSELSPFGGILYYIDSAPDNVRNKIKELEDNGDVVYHATHEYPEFGECWDLFVITDEDVGHYGHDMQEDFNEYGIQFAYVMNIDIPEFSEFGSIQVETRAGGVVRVS